jgi:hypothetical protein
VLQCKPSPCAAARACRARLDRRPHAARLRPPARHSTSTCGAPSPPTRHSCHHALTAATVAAPFRSVGTRPPQNMLCKSIAFLGTLALALGVPLLPADPLQEHALAADREIDPITLTSRAVCVTCGVCVQKCRDSPTLGDTDLQVTAAGSHDERSFVLRACYISCGAYHMGPNQYVSRAWQFNPDCEPGATRDATSTGRRCRNVSKCQSGCQKKYCPNKNADWKCFNDRVSACKEGCEIRNECSLYEDCHSDCNCDGYGTGTS